MSNTEHEQDSVQAQLQPMVGLNVVDNRVQLTIKSGVEHWQAIGLLEVALKLLKDSYK